MKKIIAVLAKLFLLSFKWSEKCININNMFKSILIEFEKKNIKICFKSNVFKRLHYLLLFLLFIVNHISLKSTYLELQTFPLKLNLTDLFFLMKYWIFLGAFW